MQKKVATMSNKQITTAAMLNKNKFPTKKVRSTK